MNLHYDLKTFELFNISIVGIAEQRMNSHYNLKKHTPKFSFKWGHSGLSNNLNTSKKVNQLASIYTDPYLLGLP